MESVALVLLILVGYSAGAAFGARGCAISPGLGDIVLVILAWTAGLVSQPRLGKWAAVGAWLLVAGLCAWAWTSARLGRLPSAKPSSTAVEGRPLQRLWERWKRFAQRMGNFQGRVLLALFYFVVVTPFALLTQWLSDPLHLKGRAGDTAWLARPAVKADIENVRRQF